VNNNLLNVFRFILLLFVQVFIFNNINLLGYINPFPYILFILLFPVNGNKSLLLLSSFTLGLLIDIFSNSGGIHATASLCLAFVRPSLFKFSFGLSYEYQTVKIADKISPERITFLLLAIFIHHFILFSLEFYRFSLIANILGRSFVASIFTLIFCTLIIYLIKPSKR
jgi:rod shape-determining protein MreD